MRKIICIDRYSHGWVHKDFNLNFTSCFDKGSLIYIGNTDSDAYRTVESEKRPSVDGSLRLLRLVRQLDASDSRSEIVFLVLTKFDVFPAIILKLCGYQVGYVYHKLTLRCRLTRWHWKLIFRLLDGIAVHPLCLETPHPIFKWYKLIRIDQFRNVVPNGPYSRSIKYGKIAFIGRPDDGKNFATLENVCSRVGFEIVVFSDEPIDVSHEHRPHCNEIHDCDFLWAYYDFDYYMGIQSGLPYVALASGLRLITNRNIGFGNFSKEYPEFCLSFSDPFEIERFLTQFLIRTTSSPD